MLFLFKYKQYLNVFRTLNYPATFSGFLKRGSDSYNKIQICKKNLNSQPQSIS